MNTPSLSVDAVHLSAAEFVVAVVIYRFFGAVGGILSGTVMPLTSGDVADAPVLLMARTI
jgi:hypothetical protein